MVRKDNLLRWHDPNQFREEWVERNFALMGLMSHLDLSPMTAIEYGCGPNKPFKSNFQHRLENIFCSDTKKWDNNDILINLNDSELILPNVDVAILSGVLEYLTNLRRSLSYISKSSKYILFSYMYLNQTVDRGIFFNKMFNKCSSMTIDKIQKRIVLNGMRNHLTLNEIINLSTEFGYIESIGKWNQHVIVLLNVQR